MKILATSLYVGLLLTTTSFQSQAIQFKQADDFYQPSVDINETEFSMFPQENDIENFPNALADTEADPKILGEYYTAVAQAYRTWGEKQKDLVTTYKIQAQAQQEKLFWTQVKKSDFASHRPLVQARTQVINYNKENYGPAFFKLELMSKKADSYQEIAETYKMLQDS